MARKKRKTASTSAAARGASYLTRKSAAGPGARTSAARSRGVSTRSKSARSMNGSQPGRPRGATSGNGVRSRSGASPNPWSARDDRELRSLVRKSVPAREIGKRMGRTESAIRQHVHKLGISFRTGR